MPSDSPALCDFLESFLGEISVGNYVARGEGGGLDKVHLWMSRKEEGALLSFVAQIAEQEHFDLDHPENSKIRTRARCSARIGTANVILFSDKDDHNWWGVVQLISFIDAIVLPGKLVKFQ